MCLYFPLHFQLLRVLPFFQLCAYKDLILALFLGYSNPSYLQVSQNLGTIFQYFLLRCLFLNPSQLFQKIYSNLIIRHLESLLLFALLSWLYWVASSVLEFFNKNFVLKLVGLWLIYLLFMEKISRHSIRSSKIFKYIYFHLHWYFLQKARAPSLWSNLNELLFSMAMYPKFSKDLSTKLYKSKKLLFNSNFIFSVLAKSIISFIRLMSIFELYLQFYWSLLDSSRFTNILVICSFSYWEF